MKLPIINKPIAKLYASNRIAKGGTRIAITDWPGKLKLPDYLFTIGIHLNAKIILN